MGPCRDSSCAVFALRGARVVGLVEEYCCFGARDAAVSNPWWWSVAQKITDGVVWNSDCVYEWRLDVDRDKAQSLSLKKRR